METFNHKLNTYLESWMGPRDKRVQGWLLLDNYPPTFALTVMYLLIVWIGPKYMKERPAYSCRGLLVLYNLGLTLLSFYMFYELVTAVWSGGYNFYCQDTHSAQEVDNKITNVLWWYYFSKLIEFMDTFFFILRKNNHQITFLHLYHHASMLNIWWFVMNWVPCGHYPVLFNHVPDDVCSDLAMQLPQGMAVLPNKLHGHTHFPFLKLLHTDLQKAKWFSKEGAPKWRSCINEWTCKRDASHGALCTQQTEGGLTFEKPPPDSHCSGLANAARRYMYLLI
ncbi:very long chain fatty acid elongase 5-like isoform X2 [Clinocottus analis]|uniref:very long chain fatty acid elongase 5-like isoform X2 n=1 Tax=Clinocottus analis TaxID=304258 RepID=UPI0035BF534A